MVARPQVAAAYDAVAPAYEQATMEDAWMRQVLRRRGLALFRPGGHLLEVGCGTGLDALFLAGHGFRVTALDVSPGMLARLRARLRDDPARGRVRVCAADASTLASWPNEGFDGLYSTFAALNTIDLVTFVPQAARVLRPGGRLLAHLLAPPGIWTRWRTARDAGWRAASFLAAERQRTVEIGGRPVRHWVLPARRLRASFAPWFRCRRCYALGFLWPRRWGERLPPALARMLGRLEVGPGAVPPFIGWGRFLVLEMERR